MTDAEKAVWENEDGDLVVVLGATEYVIGDVDAATGLWVHSLTERTRSAQPRLDAGEAAEAVDADLHLSDEGESALYARVLGATLDQLEADGVKWRQVRRLGQIAYAWIIGGVEAARRVWEPDPKANRQQRRAASRASGSTTRNAGASATTTKPRASTRSTRTRT